MLLSPEATKVALNLVEAEDFYSPKNASAFAAIRQLHSRGETVDVTTVNAAAPEAELPTLLGFMANVPSWSNASEYAHIITGHSARRRVVAVCAEATKAALDLEDPYDVVDRLAAELGMIDSPLDESKQKAKTVEEIIATAEDLSPWLIEGMMRRDWRALLVAKSGQGKSVVLRQIAMMSAQGIHPFKFHPIPKIRTLIIDLENPAASIAETGERIAQRLVRDVVDYDPSRCRIFQRPGGMDPRRRHDRGELEREITLQRPDLVCIGPVYKMLHRRAQKGGTESHEEATSPLLAIFDDLRIRHGFAMVIETHAPHNDLRPYGSQQWESWPEIGIALRPDTQAMNTWALDRFRGDRMLTDWPATISYGSVWPWVGTWGKTKTARSPIADEPF